MSIVRELPVRPDTDPANDPLRRLYWTVTSYRPLRWLVGTGLAMALAPLVVWAGLRLVAHDAWWPMVLINAYTFWIYLPAYPIGAVAAFWRLWPHTGVAAAIVVLHFWWVAPDYWPAESPGYLNPSGERLTLTTANLFAGNPDFRDDIADLVDGRADVILLQELTPDALAAAEASELDERYPHGVVEARVGGGGIAVYSRLPLVEAETFSAAGSMAMRVVVDTGRGRLVLYNVHPPAPVDRANIAAWNANLDAIRDRLEAEEGCVVAAGDWNMTQHHAWYDRIRATGLKDAQALLGHGSATTWPNGLRRLPPIRIDQVFVSSGVTPLSVSYGAGRGTDHRPVSMELALNCRP